MLSIRVDDADLFDEKTETFIPIKGQTLQLEHSLVSISKWEAKWKKPFLSRESKTREETLDYIRFMTITQNVNPLLYTLISDQQIQQINAYIDDARSATTISKIEGKGGTNKIITSEEIYYYLVAYQIPFKVETWHFNRMMTLIRICDERNKPKKKMKRSDVARRYRTLNAARRARSGSRG